jgi:putative ABC transport system ATP-binding protein
MTTLVEAREVVRVYREGGGERPVLQRVDLRIGEGECVALLGRSGSGKSTLLNLLAGIDTPDEGEILIRGQCINRLSERERTLFRRRHIGFVYQLFNLISTLTVEENIGLPLELNGVGETEIGKKVARLLGEIGLGDRSSAFPDRLSGGEQQRVAVARALIHEPALILADEPTGNLDGETGRRVLDLLTDLSRRYGRTLIIVTHSLAVARAADRVVTLKDGVLTLAQGDFAW